MKAEWNFEQDVPAMTTGGAEAKSGEDDHGPHVFLYVPDMAAQTGWSSHQVPTKDPARPTKQPVGFLRR